MYIKLEFVLGRDSGAVKIPIYTKKRIYILEYCIKEYIRKCYESAQKIYVKKKKKSVNEKSFIYIQIYTRTKSLIREIHTRNYYVINHIILYKIFRNFLNYISSPLV